ncbi:MAG: hypothetical protein ACYC7J_05825 [Syntrophales bacterium]
MKKISYRIMAALFVAVLLGCSVFNREIGASAGSDKAGIFSEVRSAEAILRGSAHLVIKADIKTHVEGYYVLESRESMHGKLGYPFLFSIDGQRVVWKVDGSQDNKPAYEADGKTSRDPEAREGIKYTLEKNVRLNPGVHKVFFSLPEENYEIEADITLKEGEAATLEFRPVYRTKRSPTRIPTFLKGIARYEVFLNGVRLI